MIGLLIAVLGCAGETGAPPAAEGQPVLVYTASVDGEIEPCG